MDTLPPLEREVIRQLLEAFDLRTLFIDQLGWDHGGEDLTVRSATTHFRLQAVGQKRGFVAYQCVVPGANLPDRATRQKIERQVAKTAHEHLIVFATEDHGTLCWQWVKRELRRTPRYRQQIYTTGQSAEALTQRLENLRFTLDEEERISIAEATSRAAKAFDVEKVTKRFYERFREEHGAFLGFIKGIRELANREWYASLMLNRMMFIYFIQKRGFLDDDRDYLRNRLAEVAKKKGNGKFHSFYRVFLRRLFHEGLGQPEADRDPDLIALVGRVPYLNGGLFDVHDLERDNPNINIPDEAFKRIFDFFDAYQWHLDDRPLRDDSEINPDVLGYIFEKYVNQKQMGAYYTKEDITGYISRNTVVPRLFEQAERDCAIAFKPGGSVWRLLAEDPDRYLYPAVRHGITLDMSSGIELDEPRALPKEVAAGLKDVAKRGEWNNAASSDYALPTETWREHIARRQRYEEVRAKLAAGQVCSINDLVTYNLDIERFAQDAISTSEGPELVRAFWKAISNVTILDPTVGSGAFLFAALNVLEPLYNACLDAMRAMVEDLKHSKRKHRPERLSDFRKIIGQVEEHPNERYFVLKSIVIDNLCVDIMEEAVEICKLRLFLKLVAQLETYDQIEPLPDIDFNVRPGNTLVGFTSMDEVENTLNGDCVSLLSLPAIKERAELADAAFRQFRSMQTERHYDAALFSESKNTLRERLGELRQELDTYLADDYGIRRKQKGAYRKWQGSHQPFHWFVEFYRIIERGGFDVVIGNPPYVESRTVKDYVVRGYQTETSGNLYTLVVERIAGLVANEGRTGMIIPHSAICTDRMGPLAEMLARGSYLWTSTYDVRPAKLFDGADQRLLIYLTTGDYGFHSGGNRETNLFSTRYHRWHTIQRASLLQQVNFTNAKVTIENSVSKIGGRIEHEILDRLQGHQVLKHDLCQTGNQVYYHDAPRYWIRATDFAPYFWNERDGEKVSSHVKAITLNKADVGATIAILNSSLFYWWFICWSDCRDLNRREIDQFPMGLDVLNARIRRRLAALTSELMGNFRRHSQRKETNYATTGRVVYDEFNQKASKSIVDKIDRALAPHYGLTAEQIDFLVNYDIKFRMGVGG